MPLALELLQQLAGVAAVAQRGVVAGLARPDLEDVQNLIHHDGDVHPRRGLAALDDLLHIGPVFLRVVLLVLLLKGAWVGALVPGTAPVLLLHGINSFSERLSYHSRGRITMLFPHVEGKYPGCKLSQYIYKFC